MSFLGGLSDFLGDVGTAILQTSVGVQPDVGSVGGVLGGVLGTLADPFVPDILRPFFPGPTTTFGSPMSGLPILSPGLTSANVPVGSPIGSAIPLAGELIPGGGVDLAQCAPPPGWVIETNRRGVVSMHPKRRRRARRPYPPTVWNQMLLAASAFAPRDRVIVLSGLAR